jgi:hypothetical protein
LAKRYQEDNEPHQLYGRLMAQSKVFDFGRKIHNEFLQKKNENLIKVLDDYIDLPLPIRGNGEIDYNEWKNATVRINRRPPSGPPPNPPPPPRSVGRSIVPDINPKTAEVLLLHNGRVILEDVRLKSAQFDNFYGSEEKSFELNLETTVKKIEQANAMLGDMTTHWPSLRDLVCIIYTPESQNMMVFHRGRVWELQADMSHTISIRMEAFPCPPNIALDHLREADLIAEASLVQEQKREGMRWYMPEAKKEEKKEKEIPPHLRRIIEVVK